MVSEKILVGSALGIHLRPAGAMCDTAVKFDSHITFIRLLMQRVLYQFLHQASAVAMRLRLWLKDQMKKRH